VAEAEIAQRSLYRLETRVGNLFNDFQAAGSERVDRRLRLLTVISAITLPLGLIAGLLGMNVGGLPGTGFGGGFGSSSASWPPSLSGRSGTSSGTAGSAESAAGGVGGQVAQEPEVVPLGRGIAARPSMPSSARTSTCPPALP